MKTSYDADGGTLSIHFTDAAAATSEEVKPGILLDLDGDGRLVGFTIRNAKAVLPASIDPFKLAELEEQTENIAAAAAHGSTA